MPIVFTDAQFTWLLDRVTRSRVVETAPDAAVDLTAVAAVDLASAAALQKFRAGNPIHQLAAEEREVVRHAWIRDRQADYFARGRRA